ncbi:hypothetical protein P7C70_g1295, partial [Phenoliferia sp. Uapishka_3]
MPLIRQDVYQYLKRCSSDSQAVEEVLGAYVYSKYRAGNSDVRVLLKLRYLAQFLMFRNMQDFVLTHRYVIHCISCDVHHRAGGDIGSREPETDVGRAAWSQARNPSGLARLRRDGGHLDVALNGSEASDGHFQGLGAVRRKGRLPVEDVDAVSPKICKLLGRSVSVVGSEVGGSKGERASVRFLKPRLSDVGSTMSRVHGTETLRGGGLNLSAASQGRQIRGEEVVSKGASRFFFGKDRGKRAHIQCSLDISTAGPLHTGAMHPPTSLFPGFCLQAAPISSHVPRLILLRKLPLPLPHRAFAASHWVTFQGNTMKRLADPTTKIYRANFRLGIFGPELIMKTLEWGMAIDRKPYQWIGFDGLESEAEKLNRVVSAKLMGVSGTSRMEKEPEASGTATTTALHEDGSSPLVHQDVGESGKPAVVKTAKSKKAAKHDSPWEIFTSSLHLMTAMRGIGYSFGPPAQSLAPPPDREPRQFLKAALVALGRAHFINTISIIIIINREDRLPSILGTYFFPFLSPSSLLLLSSLIAYFFVGISLWSQMIMGISGTALALFTANIILRKVLPTEYQPAPFDSREWPPLFKDASVPRSVTIFWREQWHALFRKPFTFVGYDPVVGTLSSIVGKPSARLLGAFSVFLLSGWLHDQGFWSARHGLAFAKNPLSLSFTERYGAWLFFIAQAVAVGLEGAFPRMTGKRVGGKWATLWSYFWIDRDGAGERLAASHCVGLAAFPPPVRRTRTATTLDKAVHPFK